MSMEFSPSEPPGEETREMYINRVLYLIREALTSQQPPEYTQTIQFTPNQINIIPEEKSVASPFGTTITSLTIHVDDFARRNRYKDDKYNLILDLLEEEIDNDTRYLLGSLPDDEKDRISAKRLEIHVRRNTASKVTVRIIHPEFTMLSTVNILSDAPYNPIIEFSVISGPNNILSGRSDVLDDLLEMPGVLEIDNRSPIPTVEIAVLEFIEHLLRTW